MNKLIRNLNQNEFINGLNRSEFPRPKGHEINVTEKIVLNSENYKKEFSLIQNIIFLEDVSFTEIDILSGIVFINCEFRKDVIFKNVKSTDSSGTKNTYNAAILFNNCIANRISFSNDCSFKRGVKVESNSEITFINIDKLKIDGAPLYINKSTVDHLTVRNSICESLDVENSTIVERLTFNQFTGDINLSKSKFNDSIIIENNVCNNLEFKRSIVSGDLEIKSCKIVSLSFVKCALEGVSTLLSNRPNEDCPVKNIKIQAANFFGGFEIQGYSNKMNLIELPLSPETKGVLKIRDIKIKETKLSGVNQNLKLIFKNTSFKQLIINDLTNYGELNFDKCKSENEFFKSEDDDESSIIARDSDFGLTRFNEVDFTTFNYIQLDNVVLDKIRASNVIWFENDKLRVDNTGNNSDIVFRRKREIYRQIKQALRSSGNHIDSLTFQAKELRSYQSELKTTENYGLGDKLIMLVSRTNNFGINWLKPAGLIFLITFIFYFIFTFLLSNWSFYPSLNRIDGILTLIKLWNGKEMLFQLFNPVRRVSLVFGNFNNDWIYFWDYLHRLLLGIFIFQIIKAFRRFVSK